KVAAGVVDPGAAVLPGRAALEGDSHRRVRVGRVDLVTDGFAAGVLKEMGEGDTVHREARDARFEEILRDGRLEDLAPRVGLLLSQAFAERVDVFASCLAERLGADADAAGADRFAVDEAEELCRQWTGQGRVRRGTGLVVVVARRVIREDVERRL